MAHPWQYPRWRRYVMQAALCVVLGGTIALAALVNHQIRLKQQVTLDPPRTYSDLSVRLPANWELTVDDSGSTLILHASEPGPKPYGRKLLILRQRTSEFISPMEYLTRLEAWTPRLAVSEGNHPMEPIEILGWPGVLLARPAQAAPNGTGVQPKLVQACAVLPTREAILIRLEGAEPLDPGDRQLVRDIAASLALPVPAMPAATGGKLALEGGITLTIPEGFHLVPESDPDRIARQLLYSDPDGHWASIELIPFLLENSRPNSLLALAALHGPRWLGGTVSADGTRRWRITPPAPTTQTAAPAAEAQRTCPARADIVAGANGQAILALMHAGPVAPNFLDTAWNTLAASAHFAAANDLPTLLGNGAQEAQRLSGLGLEPLIPTREEEWWLWSRDTRDHYLGWTHFFWSDPSSPIWRAARDTRRRDPQGIVRVAQSWASSADLAAYLCTTDRYESAGAETEPFVHTLHQVTQLKDGQLLIRYASSGGTETATGPAPPQFVPGGWLPLLLGQLQPRSMVLKTDQFTGYEGVQFPGLLTLIVEPVPPAPTTSSATAPAYAIDPSGARPGSRRVVRVRVNGSSEFSRWTFINRDELESVDFPGGIRRLPADRQDIKLDFDQDSRLDPDADADDPSPANNTDQPGGSHETLTPAR
jgi:hypothetical protein